MDYRYIGKDAPVSDAAAKAAGSLPYAGDLHLPRMLHMKLILSPVAHGEVCAIDASQALALEGVANTCYRSILQKFGVYGCGRTGNGGNFLG